VSKIIDGTTKAAKAVQADSATNATTADSAAKWATARTLGVSVNSGVKSDGSTAISANGSQSVDGTANKTIAVTLGDSGVAAGTYSAVQVNTKGIAVAGGQMVEIGTSGQVTPSASLATGGLFFKMI
jgi:phage-related tail fiber protein